MKLFCSRVRALLVMYGYHAVSHFVTAEYGIQNTQSCDNTIVALASTILYRAVGQNIIYIIQNRCIALRGNFSPNELRAS